MTKNYTFTIVNPALHDTNRRLEKAKQIYALIQDVRKQKPLDSIKILSVGCARGVIPHFFSKKVTSTVGIDLDPSMISYAKKHFKEKNLSFFVMDAHNLSFADNSFDVVVCSQLLNWVKNPQKVIDEIYRVLTPGGMCIVANANKYTLYDEQYFIPLLSILPQQLAYFLVRRMRGIEPVHFSYLSYWQLQAIANKFTINHYSPRIVHDPKKFGFKKLAKLQRVFHAFPLAFWNVLEPLYPNFIWILQKPKG